MARDLSISAFAKANDLTLINNGGTPVSFIKPAGKTYYLIESQPRRMDWPDAKTLTDSYEGAQMFVPFNKTMDKSIYDALKSMNRLDGPFWYGLSQDRNAAEILGLDKRPSIYAPIGNYKDLLPYLVRRLLENGANSSFINQYLSNEIPLSDLSCNPAAEIQEQLDHMNLSNLPLPSEIYISRQNSHGIDFSEPESIKSITEHLKVFEKNKINASALSSLTVDSLDAIDTLSRCNQSNIGLVYFSDPASVINSSFQISSEWMNTSLDQRALVLTEVANSIETQSLQFIYLLMHEAGKTIQELENLQQIMSKQYGSFFHDNEMT